MKIILSTITCLFLLQQTKPIEITRAIRPNNRIAISGWRLLSLIPPQKSLHTSSNADGRFEIALKPGEYNFQISSLHYETINILKLQPAISIYLLYIPSAFQRLRNGENRSFSAEFVQRKSPL